MEVSPFSARLRLLCSVMLAGCLLCLGGLPAEAKTKKAKKSLTPAESPTPPDKDSGKEGKKGAIDIPIPINHSAEGVCIPIRASGKLQMRYNMEVAFRVDDEQFRLTQLKLETFDDDGNAEMVIDMPLSMLNVQTRILTSAEPVTIRRTDLELVGKNMTFDTQTRQGKFVGSVRVLIYKHDEEEPQKPVAPATGTSAPLPPQSAPAGSGTSPSISQ